MKFHSEWLLDDPIEVMTDLEKNLHSTDEIDRLSTNDNFSDIDKALYLLDKGQLSQKLWVVRAIDTYMRQVGADTVIAELIDRLPYWNESAQEEAGKAFHTVLINNCFPSKYYENLLLLVLHIIEAETWSLQEIWGDVLFELTKRYQKRCLSEAFNLSSFNQTDNLRSVGGYCLSAAVEANKGENSEDVLKKIYSMTQDPSSAVRKNMCKSLRVLTKVLSKKQIELKVLVETLKLIEDDSSDVLDSSLPFFAELMDYCSYQCKENIVEMMKSTFFTSQVSKLAHVKLKHFGKVIVSLRLTMDEEFRDICVKWFLGFETVNEPTIRELMIYNYPALLYIIGSMTDHLFRLIKLFEADTRWEIRRILAKMIGDVCRLSNCKEAEILQLVKSLIEDSKTFEIVLEQFFLIAKALKSFEPLLEILINKISLDSSNWRRVTAILKEITSFCTFFDCSSIFDRLIPTLLTLIKSSSNPVKNSAAKLLADILYKSLAKKDEHILKITTQLAKSSSCAHRISYIRFCAYISIICSHNFFCKYFLPSLLPLSRDLVKDVRYEWAVNYFTFRVALPFGDSELKSEFRSLLNFYLETGDKFLVETSLSCDERYDKMCAEHYGQAAEAKEAAKIKYEAEASVKEVVELKQIPARKGRKGTIIPRGSSYNPVKRYSLIDIDRAELSRVIQKVETKKKVK